MPVSGSRKHSSDVSVGKNPRQVNGFYVHSSPPKVLQVHSSILRQWLRAGDLNQLEQLVLEGQGHKLIGEYSPDSKIRNFLKQIPAFLLKSKRLHDTIARGDLKQLQKLLSSIKSHDSLLKKIHLSKCQGGLGLLHKAVYYGHPHVVEFLVARFPQCIKMRDNDEKTPLHYCGMSKEAEKIWKILVEAGADVAAMDSKGKRADYYLEHSNEIQLQEEKNPNGISISSTSDRNNLGLVIKPSNIRIWIHDRDLKKLQQMVWEGHGAKLKVETSKHPKVKRFLEGIPYVLNLIKDIHSSVVNDDLEEFLKKTSDPVPLEILGSKDINGLTPLHKAAGLNRREIVENILNRSSDLVFSVDQERKTPLHYAAALKDDNEMYNLLIRNNADETTLDRNGKTASYYKTNPKEIIVKTLEVIPEAPRTSTFPQSFDWSLFRTDGMNPVDHSSSVRNPPVKNEENQSHGDVSKSETENQRDTKEVYHESLESKKSESDDKIASLNAENPVESEEQANEKMKESEERKNFDIWTNDNDDDNDNDDYDDDDDVDDDKENSNFGQCDGNSSQEHNESKNPKYEEKNFSGGKKKESDSDEKKNTEKDKEAKKKSADYNGGFKEQTQKTEREIAEERQRLLDEGLLTINAENEESENEATKLSEIIRAGDMEQLASMVLNGKGDKLRGKTSNDSEVQSFLDNIPIYMTKIKVVHEAARNGSLKDLQAALDRRKFVIAKESSDKSGATPLHVAVIFKNTQIVKYLGGRFPETLISKDRFGRTPLHYAAVLEDNGQIYSVLLNLGADPNTEDDEGHTAMFYYNNPGELTREDLLDEMKYHESGKEQLSKQGYDHILDLEDDEDNDIKTIASSKGVTSPLTDPSIHDVEPEISFDEGIPVSKSARNRDAEEDINDGSSSQTNFSLTDRDEYGQSVLHFAAARAHGRGGLFQLIHESGVNLGYRDELYRTARDIAQQANIPDNINEIDKYVISLAAKGETGKLMELFLEGYDHILDLEDDEDNDIKTIASSKGHDKTLAFLKAIPLLQEKREKIHGAIRADDRKLIEGILSNSRNGRFLITGKNNSGRCSLHTAVLCQQKEIVEFISQKFPETLRMGDNLERTPLHYAMGVEEVETLSKILIKCGAKRVVKDLKGRQPTYYFMNKTEILKLQEEENALKAQNTNRVVIARNGAMHGSFKSLRWLVSNVEENLWNQFN